MKTNFLHKMAASALLLAGICFSAQAQTKISVGARLGGNVSKFAYNGVQESYSGSKFDGTKFVGGFQVGASLNMDFGTVAFQPSLIFTQKGSKINSSGKEQSTGFNYSYTFVATPTLNYFELPLNVVYTPGGDHGFQLFAGPYVAFGVGGSGDYVVTVDSNDPGFAQYNGPHTGPLVVEYGDKEADNSNANNNGNNSLPPLTLTVKKLDFGLNAGVGYRFGPVQAQLGYGLGLVNIVPKDTNGNDTGSKGYNRSVQLNATYFFGAK